jgi:IclR family acetate operon transcriptional repressor
MRSLSRALEVFELLQRTDRPQRLSDIARVSAMSLPTTLRILRVLQDYGLVSQSEKTYRIGPGVLPAARSFLETDPMVTAARPILQQLAVQTQLTASVYSRLGFERILIARVDGENHLRYDLPLGKRLPLTIGAAGRVLLASATDEELQEVIAASIANGFEPESFNLDELKSRNPNPDADYGFAQNERETGVMSVAVAVPNPAGPPREAMVLTAPAEAHSRDELELMVPELKRAATRLSQILASSIY